MGKLYERIGKWKFDKKIQMLVSSSILLTAALALIISSISSVTSFRKQSIELLRAQNSTIAENFSNSLNNYKALAFAMVLDKSIQNYLKESEKRTAGENRYIPYTLDAYQSLSSTYNSFSDLNFIAVVNSKEDDYLYRGNTTIAGSKFASVYKEDYEKSKQLQKSSIRIGYNNAYFGGKIYTLSVYFPVYDTEVIARQIGLLCMNFTNTGLQQIVKYDDIKNTETMVVDTDGMIVAAKNTELIGSYTDYTNEIISDARGQQYFKREGKIYTFHKVQKWNYYVISSVSNYSLYEPSIRAIVVVVLILMAVAVVFVKILKQVIRRVYQPLDKVVKKMDDVSAGRLDSRINEKNMGEDFERLAKGFNSMMEEILVLMDQVKLEQHQVEQIRFNALQSQIQPHFLYNTLECIHWQAIADGNEEISTLVKALAKYYRICLSKGRDVITLEEELEHIRNYLIIQNMRYDNIIGSSFDVDESAKDTMLPKLTLQPLVENSIYHGMKLKDNKTGTLFVKVKKTGENVLITVSDTGTGMTQEEIDEMNQQLAEYRDSFGYGVRNVNKRIELLYGKGYGLFYKRNESGGVTVEILLPYCVKVKDDVLRGGFSDV